MGRRWRRTLISICAHESAVCVTLCVSYDIIFYGSMPSMYVWTILQSLNDVGWAIAPRNILFDILFIVYLPPLKFRISSKKVLRGVACNLDMACSRHALEPSSVEVVAGICPATATTKNDSIWERVRPRISVVYWVFQAFSRRRWSSFWRWTSRQRTWCPASGVLWSQASFVQPGRQPNRR